ncbi:MAG: hypothetical protein PHN75_09885 [Syntrophales bacterium]|nr:hypothetical protein [Syntrophales bacterium]
MARANRHYLPGYVWHITHRCHLKEFLLKFSQDRKRYIKWLSEAKKRFGLSILNFIITSNHTHILVYDTGNDVIPRSMQLVYIDLNMVRAGVVVHPSEWRECGYNEIIDQPKTSRLIDNKILKSILGFSDEDDLDVAYQQVVSDAMRSTLQARQPMWTESIAVGDEDYVTETKEKLTVMALGREIKPADSAFMLREQSFPYGAHFDSKKDDLRLKNTFCWEISYE